MIATVRFEAVGAGTATIRSEPADEIDSEFLLFGIDDLISADEVAYGSTTLAIGQSFTTSDDTFTVAEDSGTTALDVLANDEVVSGNETLSVVSVSSASSGGTVSLDSGTVNFIPDADFNGTVEFTYLASDSNGIQEEASVTVTVTAVNDPPQGTNDTLNVAQNSAVNLLDVLSNDSSAPDSGEVLSIVDEVLSTSAGGTATVAADGQSILYTPPHRLHRNRYLHLPGHRWRVQ